MKAVFSRYSIIMLCSLLAVFACAPKQNAKQYNIPKADFGPKHVDTKITVPDSVTLATNQDVLSTKDLFYAAENQIQLGEKLVNPRLVSKSKKLLDSFYNSPKATLSYNLKDSPYVGVAGEKTAGLFQEKLNGFSSLIDQQEKRLLEFLKSHPLVFPATITTSTQAVTQLESLLYEFKTFLEHPDTHCLIRTAGLEDLNEDAFPRLRAARILTNNIETAKDIKTMIGHIKIAMDKFKIKGSPVIQKNITFVEFIERKIDGIDDAEDVLETLVHIWEFLTPAEKKKFVAKESEDLYEFLTDKDKQDLDCYARRNDCSMFNSIRIEFVKGKIESYGIKKIKKKLEIAIKEAANKVVLKNVQDSLQSEILKFQPKILAAFNKQRKDLSQINPNEILGKIFSNWAAKEIKYNEKDQLRGFETELSNFVIEKNENGYVASIDPIENKTNEVKGATIGLSLLNQTLYWEKFSDQSKMVTDEESTSAEATKSSIVKSLFETLNKTLIISGFKNAQGQVQEGFLSPIVRKDLIPQKPVEIQNMLKSPLFFSVPDSVVLENPIKRTRSSKDQNVSVETQAELLRGYTQLFMYLNDFEGNSSISLAGNSKKGNLFDDTLGSHKALDYMSNDKLQGSCGKTPDAPKEKTENSNDQLFPKEPFFAMSVANAGIQLKNMLKDLSPAFVLDLDSKLYWVNEYVKDKSIKTAVAGVVDLNEASRTNTVESLSVSKFLLALIDFYTHSKELKKTKSKMLLAKDPSDNLSAVDELQGSREKIKELIVGLANLLSRQMNSKSGGIEQTFSLQDKKTITFYKKRLIDQVYAIKALNAASNLIENDFYRKVAIDIVYFMNRNLYNPEYGFYSETEEKLTKPNLSLILTTLNTLQDMKPLLPASSRSQMDLLIQTWVSELEKVKYVTVLSQSVDKPAPVDAGTKQP